MGDAVGLSEQVSEKVQRFFKEICGKRVAVVGVGVSNNGVVQLLCEKGALVTVHDKRTRAMIGEETCALLEDAGALLVFGEDYLQDMACDILFRAPGMYYNMPFLSKLRADGVVITSEMEVFFDLCPCRTFAVTGSDGKTTTTAVITQMLRAAGYRVHMGGNIGKALLPLIETMGPEDMAVIELSSFQLLSMRCAPYVSVVTNVTPNHLDVHQDMQEYIDAKKNIFLHQNAFSKTILNMDNGITRAFATQVRGKVAFFSRFERPERGVYLDAERYIVEAGRQGIIRILSRDDILLPGEHNVENYLAAIAAVEGFVEADVIRQVARTFGGVEHRIEFVRELRGVRWYNDSIASSPTRTIAGLRAFPNKLIIIAGGYDKKIPFEPLAPEMIQHVKTLILMGATAAQIERVVTQHPDYDAGALRILHAEDMAHAVGLAAGEACEGDVVSLSPACASFDAYPNFEARGKHFKELVQTIQ